MEEAKKLQKKINFIQSRSKQKIHYTRLAKRTLKMVTEKYREMEHLKIPLSKSK